MADERMTKASPVGITGEYGWGGSGELWWMLKWSSLAIDTSSEWKIKLKNIKNIFEIHHEYLIKEEKFRGDFSLEDARRESERCAVERRINGSGLVWFTGCRRSICFQWGLLRWRAYWEISESRRVVGVRRSRETVYRARRVLSPSAE